MQHWSREASSSLRGPLLFNAIEQCGLVVSEHKAVCYIAFLSVCVSIPLLTEIVRTGKQQHGGNQGRFSVYFSELHQ